MTEREGPWSNLRSQCRLAREFRRLEAISAFEVSILVLMEQASCCTSVKTGSNFNWIPRLDFIGSVPTGEERRGNGKRQVSVRFLIVDSVSLSANREFWRCSRRGKIDCEIFDERIRLNLDHCATWFISRKMIY